MAEQDNSVFTGIFKALSRGEKKTKETDKNILTNAPVVNPFASKQQKQQDFLDIQSKKISEDLSIRSMYYEADRFTAYQDYKSMDNSPEVSAALDILSDECVSKNEKGEILGIYSDNSRVKNTLKDLFYNVLNINYNLGFWTRELIKFGDTFLKLEVDQDAGVYDIMMLPVGEVHRIENKTEELGTSKFKWDNNNLFFEEWQVAHFRLLSDGNRLPYGRSILEPARKLWKQLQLAEDAMLVYRAVRAPERRVYYIEVGNIDPADVPQYMEKAKASVKKTPMVDQSTGNVNLKFAPMPVWKNTPIPLLDGRTITIEELAKEFESGKENYVYSIQDETHQIVGGKVIWCGKNYTANELTKVWLDDNTWVLTAPEHPFILRDGSEKMASDLIEGDALMPYYEDFERIYKEEKNTRTYKRVYNPNSGKYEYVHRLISKENEKINPKHNTVHHKDFNRYNNSFNNLEWVDFHEHRKMHREVSKKNITKYNKSEAKIKRVSELNIERNSIQHISWYNHSELHTEHNEIRSGSLIARWNNEESRKELKSSMTIKVDKNCFNLIVEEIKKYKNFVNAEDFIKNLKNSEVYFLIKTLNKNSNRNIDTFFNSKGNLRKILNENGIENYKEFLEIFNPLLLELKKENYRNSRIKWNENNLIKNEKGQFEYKNHKVLRVETIFENEDVYCMTVVGNNGEHDRHNFALYSFDASGNRTNSGVFVKNSYEEDYFLPVRGDKSSRIETLPGACLSLNTKIELLDGRSIELQEIIKEWDNGNKNLWSYSINPNTGEIVPGIITWAGVTRKNTQVVKITLDNGETFTVTPDHKFPTRFNGIKEAKKLLINESLWSFSKNVNTKSQFIFDHALNNYEKELCFNHKIISIEWLDEKQDTGTITIDGNEIYHDFHNFALSCGVFTQNSNLSDIADIEYLQNKLFAALKVPKPYLNYAETIPGGSALAQADLRFSRTINRLQQFLVIELRRIANIHLYFLGFEDDINNFELTLTNPSSQQELLKLETMKSRLEVFKELFTNEPTSPVSYTWAMQYIMGFSESEIKQILRQKKIERKMFAEIEGAADEYIETGIFNDLDRKFRKPGFVPGQATGADGGADSGADAGGGGSSFGGMGGGGLDLSGGGGLGGGDLGADAGGDLGAGTDDLGSDAGGDLGADLDVDEEPLSETKKTKNSLQKNNAAINRRTKIMMENIEKHLKSLDDGVKEKEDDNLITG